MSARSEATVLVTRALAPPFLAWRSPATQRA